MCSDIISENRVNCSCYDGYQLVGSKECTGTYIIHNICSLATYIFLLMVITVYRSHANNQIL